MSCSSNEKLLNLYFEGDLSEEKKSYVEEHALNCLSCSNEMRIFSEVDQLVGDSVTSLREGLVAPNDFTQSVMAQVYMKKSLGSAPQKANIFKRSFAFVAIYAVYAIYVVHTVIQSNGQHSLAMQRSLGFGCLAIAALGLAFLFFTKELMSLDNNLWTRFSKKYEAFTKIDYQLGRLVGGTLLVSIAFYHLFL